MSDKSYLKIFITQLNSFIDDLILLWPDDNEFRVFKNGIGLLNKTNPRKIVQLFGEYVNKYENKILQRDETFFLKNDYNEIEKTENILNSMDKLKIYWVNLSDQNKEKVWKYFEILLRLSKMV
mgnify:CR=1 FL=1